MDENFSELYEVLVYQQKLLLDCKIQVEALKAMMFEHRPPFIEAFAQQAEKIAKTPAIQNLQAQIEHLESTLNRPR